MHQRWHRPVRTPEATGTQPRLPRSAPRGRGAADAAERFRERHVRLGVILSLATIVEVAGYTLLGSPHADPALLLTLSVVATIINVFVWVLAPSVARLRFHSAFFVAWSGGTTVLILVAAALDGGAKSPFTLLLFLPMLYAAQAYPPLGALLLGAEGALGFATVCYADTTANDAGTAVMAGSLGLATLMAAQAASNREQQARELDALTALLEADATHDGLTKCVNRRGFDAALDSEVARATRYGRGLSLLLLDVDHLKEINDALGHAGGDQVLKQVASALRKVGRRNDVCARFGGDEFALLAPELPLVAAIRLADRLHAALRQEAGAVPVTVSVGVAAFGGTITTAGGLVRGADAAMYAAKNAGRDRTARFAVDSGAAAAG